MDLSVWQTDDLIGIRVMGAVDDDHHGVLVDAIHAALLSDATCRVVVDLSEVDHVDPVCYCAIATTCLRHGRRVTVRTVIES